MNTLKNWAQNFLKACCATDNALLLGLSVLKLVIHALTSGSAAGASPTEIDVDMGSVANLGNKLFTTYLLPFEIASILLLSAIVGAVVLTKRIPDQDKTEE